MKLETTITIARSFIFERLKNLISVESKTRLVIFICGLSLSGIFSALAINYYEFREKGPESGNPTIHNLLDHWHQISIDLRMEMRPYSHGNDRIAILAIDDDSLAIEGRWPWRRTKIAQLIEKAFTHGVKLLSFDIIFSEEDGNTGLDTIQIIRDRVADKTITEKIDSALEDAKELLDPDQVLADSIKRHQNNIVLGVYSQGEDFKVNPFSELCLDSLYVKSYAHQYWERNSIKIQASDTELAKFEQDRNSIANHLEQYFTLLTLSESQIWLDSNPNILKAIASQLRKNNIDIDESHVAGLLVVALQNDFLDAKNLLREIAPEHASYSDVKYTFEVIRREMGHKNTNILSKKISRVGMSYCERFFTRNDELTYLQKFTELWGTSNEIEELFNNLAWKNLWANERNFVENSLHKTEKKIEELKNRISSNNINQVAEWIVNIPKLSEASMHSGYFNALQDSDGLIRRTKLVTRHGNFYSPSLAFKTFLVDQNLQANLSLEAETNSHGSKHKIISNLSISSSDSKIMFEIPVEDNGTQRINYHGPNLSFPHISATQLLDDREEMTVSWRHKQSQNGPWILDRNFKVKKKDFLENKILFVGATAIGIYDLRVTPLDSNFPGVETHANILSNLMAEKKKQESDSKQTNTAYGFLTNLEAEASFMPLFLLCVGSIQSGVLVFFGAVFSAIFTVSLLALFIVLDQLLLFERGQITALIFPLFLLSSLYMVLTLFRYFSEERKKTNLKLIFEKYVSPEVVDEILSKPGAIKLGGRKERMTVLFSDIRDFTRIAESMPPEELSTMLNDYFTPMTNLVYQNRGTFDKYIGDAIMAFWGAPLPLLNHAESAARCALQMQKTLKTLAAHPESRLRGMRIGIGINTGEMNVGNMGSDTIRSYTVIGDAVNIGARLESLTKEYGVNILISADTYYEIKNKFWCREIEDVLVKGKQTSVTIYELIDEKTGDISLESFFSDYDSALKLYKEKKYEESAQIFKRLALAHSDDKILWRYLKLCQNHLEKPAD